MQQKVTEFNKKYENDSYTNNNYINEKIKKTSVYSSFL